MKESAFDKKAVLLRFTCVAFHGPSHNRLILNATEFARKAIDRK